MVDPSKTIGIMVATFNEEENVELLYEAIKATFKTKLAAYEFRILFIDNASTDHTRAILRKICERDKRVLCILNARNFGAYRSSYHAIVNCPGDAVISLCADFQDPPELIPDLVRMWANGNKVVLARKKRSHEGFLKSALRSIYYFLLSLVHGNNAMRDCTGFGIYDRSIVNKLASIIDPIPFFRGIVSEITSNFEYLDYVRPARKHGTTKMNFYRLYEEGIIGITNGTVLPLRLIILVGLLVSVLSVVVGFSMVVTWFFGIFFYPPGIIPILIVMLFFFGLVIFLMGTLAEYVGAIYQQVLARDRVYEDERINFD